MTNDKLKLTHLNAQGHATMVDISQKNVTTREAFVQAKVKMKRETLQLIKDGSVKKGDVLAVAQVAGIMGAKKNFELIPMCHPLQLSSVNITFEISDKNSEIIIFVKVKTNDRTGVEMEALTGACIAALTIYDMCKAVDKSIVISDICLLEKTGGKSGTYIRNTTA